MIANVSNLTKKVTKLGVDFPRKFIPNTGCWTQAHLQPVVVAEYAKLFFPRYDLINELFDID